MARSVSPGGQPGWLLKSVILLSPVPMALAFSAVTPILPKMSAALAHSPQDAYLVKMTLGVVGVAMVLGSLLGGWLADKVERRLLMTVACVLAGLGGAAPFVLDSLPLILASRLVMGFGGITAYVAGAALIGDLFDDTGRAKWMGAFTAVAIVGGMIAMGLAGVLGDAGWRWAFLTYLVGVPIGLLALVGMRGLPRPAGARAEAAHGEGTARAAFPFALAGLGLLIGVIIYAPSIYAPFHLANLGAAKPSTIGDTLLLAMVSSTAASALFGRARLKISSRAAFGWSFACLAVGLALLGAAPVYAVAVVGVTLQGAGIGWLTPNLMASAAQSVDEAHRGRVLGVVRAAYSFAPAAGVTALEPVADAVGPDGVILLTAALAGVMVLATAALGLRGGLRGRPSRAV
jgi:MFS family permease